MALRATYLAVLGVTLTGQLAALGFEMATAARFGTGRDADALAFALTLIVTVTGEVAGWVSTLVVPLYVHLLATSVTSAAAFLRRMLGALVVLTGAGALLLAFGAHAVVDVLAPALGERGVTLVQALTPLLVLVPLAALFASALQAHGHFVAAGARQLAWYGGGLAAVLWGAATLGPVAAALGMLMGTAIFSVALGASAFVLIRGRGAVEGGPSVKQVGTLLVPLALLSTAAAVNIAVERAIAARLPEGSLAALTYAYRLLHFPLALFVVNASAMLLPTLAGHSARGEDEAADHLTRRAVQVTVVFAVPLAALALALAEPLTVVLLQRGAFTEASTARTATAIAWYAPSVVAMAIVQLLARIYQARRALWRLAGAVSVGIAVHVALMAGLTPLLGFRGLPLAASLSGLALVALMLYGLGDRAAGLPRVLLGRGAAAVAVAGFAALGAARLARGFAGDAAVGSLVAGAVVGIVVYAGVLAALAPREARAALAVVVPSGRTV